MCIRDRASAYTGGGLFLERSQLDKLNCEFQALHHQFIASSKAMAYVHEVSPEAMVGCMINRQEVYPETCNPDDVLCACLLYTSILLQLMLHLVHLINLLL